MDRIIKSYMESFLKSEQLKEKDESKRFELFTNYCVMSQVHDEDSSFLDVSTGGSNDCGIDGIAIIVNGTLVYNTDAIDDIISINKRITDIKFVFIQSKTSAKFNSSDIGTFGNGVKVFFQGSKKNKKNSIIENKKKIVDYIFSKMTYIKNKPDILMYYVTTGRWTKDSNCLQRIDSLKEDLEQMGLFNMIEFVPVDLNLLQKYYRSTIDEVEKTIEFHDKTLMPKISKISQAYIGFISYKEFFKLITTDSGDIISSIFYNNVRDFQGDNPVNVDIRETISNDYDKFVLYNNGVTIICKKLVNIGDNFTLTDYQIVNGCQTSHVLYDYSKKDNENLFIPIKLIQTNDEDTINRIIKATNRQTAITDTQLFALTDFNKKLEDFYSTFKDENMLYYERRSKQYKHNQDIPKSKIVSIKSQVKAVVAMFYNKPHLSSRFYSQILKLNKTIFSEKHELFPYYLSSLALYRIECYLKNNNIVDDYWKFKYFILNLLKVSVIGEVDDKILSKNECNEKCTKLLETLDSNKDFDKIMKNILKVIKSEVKDLSNMEITKNATLILKLTKKLIKK